MPIYLDIQCQRIWSCWENIHGIIQLKNIGNKAASVDTLKVSLVGKINLKSRKEREKFGDPIQQNLFFNETKIISTKCSFQNEKKIKFNFIFDNQSDLYSTYYGNYIR